MEWRESEMRMDMFGHMCERERQRMVGERGEKYNSSTTKDRCLIDCE
jgi:hypothetical protein